MTSADAPDIILISNEEQNMNIMMHLQQAFQEQFKKPEDSDVPGVQWLKGNEKVPQNMSSDQLELLQQAWEARREFEEAKKRLDLLNEEMIDTFGAGSSLIVEDQVNVSIASKETFSITDINGVKDYLGSRFEDLVTVREEYTLTKKFKSLTVDPDLGQFVQIKPSIVVTYRAKI